MPRGMEASSFSTARGRGLTARPPSSGHFVAITFGPPAKSRFLSPLRTAGGHFRSSMMFDFTGPGHDFIQGGMSPDRPLQSDTDVRRRILSLTLSEMGRILLDHLMEQSPASAAGMLRLCGVSF